MFRFLEAMEYLGGRRTQVLRRLGRHDCATCLSRLVREMWKGQTDARKRRKHEANNDEKPEVVTPAGGDAVAKQCLNDEDEDGNDSSARRVGQCPSSRRHAHILPVHDLASRSRVSRSWRISSGLRRPCSRKWTMAGAAAPSKTRERNERVSRRTTASRATFAR